MEPAVQSVRVAVALCDRFAELLKGPQQVTARKQEGALLGVSGNQDELSLRIGEAQQIYPEIWRLLDEARTGFATRGVDVAAYDRLRTAEGNGLGANVDVDHKTEGVGKYAVHTHTKSANFNAAGLARAREACNALMQATPDVDWAAIAKAEAHDPEAAAFGRATRRKRVIMLGLLGLAIAAPFLIVLYLRHQEHVKAEARRTPAYEPRPVQETYLSDAERASLADNVKKLETSLAAAHKAWSAITPESLKAIVAGAQPCRKRLQPPPDAAADAFIRTNDVDPKAFDASSFRAFLVGHGEVISDSWLKYNESIVGDLATRLASKKVTASDRERLANIELDATVVFIYDDVEPSVTQTAPKVVYKPGHLVAGGFVFSLVDARFVCATSIDVGNTSDAKFLDGVRRAPDAQDMLHRELEVKIRQALASELRATP